MHHWHWLIGCCCIFAAFNSYNIMRKYASYPVGCISFCNSIVFNKDSGWWQRNWWELPIWFDFLQNWKPFLLSKMLNYRKMQYIIFDSVTEKLGTVCGSNVWPIWYYKSYKLSPNLPAHSLIGPIGKIVFVENFQCAGHDTRRGLGWHTTIRTRTKKALAMKIRARAMRPRRPAPRPLPPAPSRACRWRGRAAPPQRRRPYQDPCTKIAMFRFWISQTPVLLHSFYYYPFCVVCACMSRTFPFLTFSFLI